MLIIVGAIAIVVVLCLFSGSASSGKGTARRTASGRSQPQRPAPPPLQSNVAPARSAMGLSADERTTKSLANSVRILHAHSERPDRLATLQAKLRWIDAAGADDLARIAPFRIAAVEDDLIELVSQYVAAKRFDDASFTLLKKNYALHRLSGMSHAMALRQCRLHLAKCDPEWLREKGLAELMKGYEPGSEFFEPMR